MSPQTITGLLGAGGCWQNRIPLLDLPILVCFHSTSSDVLACQLISLSDSWHCWETQQSFWPWQIRRICTTCATSMCCRYYMPLLVVRKKGKLATNKSKSIGKCSLVRTRITTLIGVVLIVASPFHLFVSNTHNSKWLIDRHYSLWINSKHFNFWLTWSYIMTIYDDLFFLIYIKVMALT